jgi:hypothetical protein
MVAGQDNAIDRDCHSRADPASRFDSGRLFPEPEVENDIGRTILVRDRVAQNRARPPVKVFLRTAPIVSARLDRPAQDLPPEN